ncbi:MAG: hypothetical protein KA314_17970, partial [Chloroflexi bacterium]|nr:hypothetical protein [Chloroflexota bacterium]
KLCDCFLTKREGEQLTGAVWGADAPQTAPKKFPAPGGGVRGGGYEHTRRGDKAIRQQGKKMSDYTFGNIHSRKTKSKSVVRNFTKNP